MMVALRMSTSQVGEMGCTPACTISSTAVAGQNVRAAPRLD